MPRDSSGNYTLVAGNPVVGGTTITPTWANPTMSDIATELTNSLDRNGRGGMLAPFKFADGTQVAPGITWNAEPTSGMYRAGGNDMRVVIAGVPRMRWTASSVDVWDTGASAWLPIIGPSGSNFALTNSPNVFTALSTNEFNALTTFKALTRITASNACLRWKSPGAPLDTKVWDFVVLDASGLFQGRHLNDAESGGNPWVSVAAAGAGIASISFGDGGSTAYNFLGTGPINFSGNVITSGQVLLQDGTVSNPSIAWASDADTGWYHPLAGQIRTIIDGNLHSVFSMASLQVQVPIWAMDGSLASPGIAFANQASTGFYRGGTSTVVLALGGAQSMVWSPTAVYVAGGVPFQISDGTAALPGLGFSAASSTGMYMPVAGTIGFSAAGVDTLRLSNGRAYVGDGSVAFPAMSFLADTDTGFCRSASNYFSAIAGGAFTMGWYNQGANPQSIINDGSAGAPALAFATDLDTGIYRITANTMGFAAGGVLTFQYDTLGVYNINGTAAHPAYTFTADSNTGIYRVSTSTIGFACAGGLAAQISSARAQFLVPLSTYYYFGSHDDTKKLYPNDGVMAYGSFYVAGATAGFHGIGIADGAMSPHFMSNGTSFGLYSQADSKWLILRNSTTSATCGYTLDAPSFISTSSRDIKRETGPVRRAADILRRLRPLFYRLLEGDDKEQLGLIAEEVHEVCPQLSDGKSVAYDRLALLLLSAWQDERALVYEP